MNIFAKAEQMLRCARVSMQEDIVYVGGDQPSGAVSIANPNGGIPLKAVRGRSDHETYDSDNVMQIVQTVDWLIDDLPLALATKYAADADYEEPVTLADLDLDDFRPKAGNYIVNALGERYEVCQSPCYRPHGADGRTLRVHTRQVHKIVDDE